MDYTDAAATSVHEKAKGAIRDLEAVLKNRGSKGEANHFLNEAINKLLAAVKLTR